MSTSDVKDTAAAPTADEAPAPAADSGAASAREAAPPPTLLGLRRAVLVATSALVATNAAFIAGSGKLPRGGVYLRALHHLYDAGQHLAVGLLAAGCVALWVRFGPRRRVWGYALLAAIAVAVGFPVLGPDLFGFAARMVSSGWAPWLRGAMVVAISLGVLAAALAGRWASRPWLRWGGVAGGLLALAVNHLVLKGGDYPGAHLYLTWAATALIAMSLATAALPRYWPKLTGALPYALVSVIAASTLAIWPSNAVLRQLLNVDGSVVLPVVARLHPASSATSGDIPSEWRKWFMPRKNARPVPPSEPRVLPPDGIVLIVSFDALRADYVVDDRGRETMPNFARVRDESIQFTEARAPGSQTVLTLTSVFTGTYYSQQYWESHPKHPHLFPHAEPTVRFTELLTKAGIATVHFSGSYWLVDEWGVVKGFSEERYVKPSKKTHYAPADDVIPPLIRRLERHGSEPLFGFVHLFDAHRSISAKREKGNMKTRYRKSMRRADHEFGKVLQTLERTGLRERTILILTSDHGEAFGEHGTYYHATTLYDELVRVPLCIRVPGAKPRRVDTPVSLMDLGPTVLDVFGLPTPGHFLAESLVGFLRGESPRLTRPILGEGRLKKYLIFPDGHKAIVDDRYHTAELYDLDADPEEESNLADDEELAAKYIGVLRAFFEVHRIRKPGYEVPWRN